MLMYRELKVVGGKFEFPDFIYVLNKYATISLWNNLQQYVKAVLQ